MKAINKKRKQRGWADSWRARKVRESDLYKELCRYQEEGIRLWLDGRPSTSYQIASQLCEKTNYMRDYQLDSKDHVCDIGFDKIRKGSKKTSSPCKKA